MLNFPIIINNRFVVHPDRNEVEDKATKVKHRLEPRLMKLLCKLAGQPGQLIRREQLITDIWADYPGANEGLNQAVSFLRKLLNDEQKTMIQTLPKSGYIFNAGISGQAGSIRFSKKHLRIGIVAVILLLLGLVITDIQQRKNVSPNQINVKHDAEISRLDSIHQAEQQKKFSKDVAKKK